jgi:type VI secretion system protein ImpE
MGSPSSDPAKAPEPIRTDRVAEEISAVQARLRAAPDDGKARETLFHLYCLTGQWDRARVQLRALADHNKGAKKLGPLYETLLQAEQQRQLVLAGKAKPTIFGEPEEWVAWQVRVLELLARNEGQSAMEFRDKAWNAAPDSPGAINGEAFDWIADADARLGPVLEVIVDGLYYWVPFIRIQSITLEEPKTLGDLVWARAVFQWRGGVGANGHIPVRYNGSEIASDGDIQFAKKTEWSERPDGWSFGAGQRLFITSQPDKEYPILGVKKIEFRPSP